jgi:hypothetical protein
MRNINLFRVVSLNIALPSNALPSGRMSGLYVGASLELEEGDPDVLVLLMLLLVYGTGFSHRWNEAGVFR